MPDADLQDEDTQDMQYDLAMSIACGDAESDLMTAFRKELRRRGAALPANCRFEYSPYYRFGRKLFYDLSESED